MPLCLLSPVFDNRWISAITKSKEEAQTMAFRGEERENSLEDDTNAIEDVQRISGDDMCCDSGSAGIDLRRELAC